MAGNRGIGDPASAPQRDDLPFLRHRVRPRPAAPTVIAPAHPVDYTHHATSVPSAPSARPSIDFSRPGRTSAPVPSTPAPSGGGIDVRHAARVSGSLDLSDAPAAARGPAAEPLPLYRGPRVNAGQQLLLGADTPSATLTRVQSGVGHLVVQAVCSAEIGDLRLGALYQLRSGGTSTVQLAGGNRFAPSSRRPVIVASRDEYDQLAIDLRQIRDLERITFYAFSESRTQLTWGGTLVVTTFGGARIELPLETLAPARIAVLASLYNLAGELVVRTELESIDGDVREAARAYGYDRITWRDDRSPVD